MELVQHEIDLNGLTTDLLVTYLHLLGMNTSDLQELMDVKLRDEEGTLHKGLTLFRVRVGKITPPPCQTYFNNFFYTNVMKITKIFW